MVRGDKPLSGEFDLGRISRQAGSAVNDFALVKSKTCFKRAIRGYTHGENKNQKPDHSYRVQMYNGIMTIII